MKLLKLLIVALSVMFFSVAANAEDKIKVGFIGLGLMGFPMAKNILRKKFCVKHSNETYNLLIVY